mgnify:CR=1 FL=1
MAFYNELDLLSASPIVIPDVCTVHPIFLFEFKGKGASERYMEYRQCLSLISMTADDTIQAFKKAGIDPSQFGSSLSQFELLMIIPIFRELLIGSLSYFIEEKVMWDNTRLALICQDNNGDYVGEISSDTYPLVRRVILESNYIEVEKDASELKFSNSKAKSIFEKLRAGKQRKASASRSSAPSISDMISAVCIRSNGYTLFNIWDLSIYQLYDQFSRLHANFEVDLVGLKWAAYGTEPFDTALWYKNFKEEKDV